MCMVCALEDRPPAVLDCIEMELGDGANPTGDTIAGDATTTATIAPGQTVSGFINTAGDEDWFRIDLEAGTRYTITMEAAGGSGLDTYLYLRDAGGTAVAANDDYDRPNTYNSQIVFQATTSGTFYISADAFSSSFGAYQLSVTASEPPAPTAPAPLPTLADYLVNGYWEANGGSARRWEDASDITVDLSGLTAGQATLARLALELWEDVANVNFREVTTGAELVWQNTERGAYATSDITNGFITSGIINMDVNWSQGNTNIDSYTLQTMIHEIGHALGLGHQGPYNGSATYGTDNIFSNDTWSLSVMSYMSQSESGSGDYRFVFTPQIVDILAIQSIYGAATGTRSGDTVYGGANSNLTGALGTIFANVTSAPAFTIYDTGGMDTLDVSQYSSNQVIDLRGGQLSSIGGLQNNMGISTTTVIERAIGGSGDDRITGNGANNDLRGNDGADVINGGGGSDRMFGGNGFDIMRGGTGNDLMSGQGDNDLMFGEVGNDVMNGNAGNDTVYGGDGNDSVYGSDGDDRLYGDAGSDKLFGGNGADRMFGGDGFDIMRGGAGNDLMSGQGDNDLLFGEAGNDIMNGNAGNDTLYGGLGNDSIYGSIGNDRLYGNEGDDTLYGGSGIDLMSGNEGNDTMRGEADNDVMNGNAGNDTLYGGLGNDTLYGSIGMDRLYGDAGNDRLFGGNGRDVLFGGSGADVFAYSAVGDSRGSGVDLIADFARGSDRIDLSAIDANTAVAGDQSFAFIGTAAFTGTGTAQVRVIANGTSNSTVLADVNGDGTIDFGVTLLNTTASDFTANDFVL